MTDLPQPLRLHFHLLDRQIVDPTDRPVGKVDDILLDQREDGSMRVVALLVGQEPLGRRIGGLVGRWISGTARRLYPSDEYRPMHIPFEFVTSIDSAVHIGLNVDTLPRAPLEEWLDTHLIARIPGAGDAG
jgi:sporulation protein YlmC with PRC-barrel domain